MQRQINRTSALGGRRCRARRRDVKPARLHVGLAALCSVLLTLSACSSPVPSAEAEPTVFREPLMGAFVPTGFWGELAAFKDLETTVGGQFDVGHWYTSWSHPYDPIPVNDLLEHGRIPLVSWQSHTPSVADIAAGQYDAYVREWARQAAQAPGVLYVRPFPEMNGYWTAWNGDAPELVRAWRRVVGIFREEGAHNVRWVYSPNVTDEPDVAGNRIEDYYPGADYVDVLALDGYNWGDARHYIGWRSFAEIFGGPYERLVALGDQPVWIAEVASTSLGGDKAGWVREMFATRGFGRVEAIVWFDEHKTVDWRIREHPEVVLAFRGALMSAQVASRPVGW